MSSANSYMFRYQGAITHLGAETSSSWHLI